MHLREELGQLERGLQLLSCESHLPHVLLQLAGSRLSADTAGLASEVLLPSLISAVLKLMVMQSEVDSLATLSHGSF